MLSVESVQSITLLARPPTVLYNYVTFILTNKHNVRSCPLLFCQQVFELMASLRDTRALDRLDFIMNGITGGGGDSACGLIQGAADSRGRNREYYRRYTDTIKALHEEYDLVNMWCQRNPREYQRLQQAMNPNPIRHHQRGYDHRDPNAHSDDSDMYTDDDDDGARLGDSVMDDPDEEFVTISGAGLAEVNGLYRRTVEICDGLPVYKMQGTWRGRACSYCLFRCKLSNGNMSWYISYVPQGVKPGTTKDVDFYNVDPMTGIYVDFPPATGWRRCSEGVDPPPNLRRHGRDMTDEELYGDAPMEEDANGHAGV